MDKLRKRWLAAVEKVKKSEDTLAIEWVNDNDGSYNQAMYDHNQLVIRANKLYLKLIECE